MNLKKTTIVFLSIFLFVNSIPANAATKSKNKIKPKPIVKTTVEPFQFTNICNSDPLVPKEWADVQEWERTKGRLCPTSYRYVTEKNNSIPKTILNFKDVSIDQCKLSSNSYRSGGFPKHWSYPVWSKSAVIQVVPVQFSDYQTNENPNIHYDRYFKYIKDFFINSSDVEIKPEIKIPNKYFKLNGTIQSYNLNDKNSNPFVSDMIQMSDTEINFSGVDVIVAVVPPSVPAKEYFSNGLPWGQVNTQEGQIKSIWLAGPISQDIRVNDEYSTSASPWIWVHELIGHIAGLRDAGGNSYEKDGNPVLNVGMGGWGNMNGMKGDFVIWDKWLMGFVSDDQISCADTRSTYINWIRPNTLKSNQTKAIVIPLGNNKAIFIESQRSVGYNYKVPKSCNGALIYTVDSNETRNNFASNLQNIKEPKTIFQCNAPLKNNQELIVSGYMIKVLEAGSFGDIVKIEKI